MAEPIVSLVPALTDYKGKGVTIAASSERDSAYPAWKAFDTSIDSANTWGWGDTEKIAWITITFDTPVILDSIRLKTNGNGFTEIRYIRLYVDGVETDIFSSKLSWWTNNGGVMDESHRPSSPRTGKRIQLTFEAARDRNFIAEIQLMGFKNSLKTLLEIGNKMYTIVDGNMLRVNESSDYPIDTFKTHSMDMVEIPSNMESIKNTGESFKIHTVK